MRIAPEVRRLGIVLKIRVAPFRQRIKQHAGGMNVGCRFKVPQRLWVEGFPEKRSYVRRLAEKQPFQCPVFGSDVGAMIRQGKAALANVSKNSLHG